MTAPAPQPSRAARAQATFQLWLVNVLVGAVVGSAWLVRVPEELSAWTRLYVGVALLASVAMWGLLPGALFVVLHRRLRERWRLAGALQAFVGILFLSVLFTDTIVHALLGYHFNGAILNVFLNPDSGDAVNLSWKVWVAVTVTISIGTVLQYVVWRAALGWMTRRETEGLRAPLVLQPRVVCLAFLLPAFGVEKSVYAAADVNEDTELLIASKRLPIYPRVRLGRLLDPEGERLPELDLFPEEATLDYPHAAPVLPADGPRPNLFCLVLDSWRRDAFDAELTPNLHAFSEGARRFDDHISSGNDTRFSLFSMLYGLHGSYWLKVLVRRDKDVPLREQDKTAEPPALLAALLAEGYDIRVFSAASMNFPKFRDTAWATLPPENVVDSFLDEHGDARTELSWKKDEFVADEVEAWLAERERTGDERPFLCFVLLDGTHQPYFNPGGPYQPSVERLEYIKLGMATEGPEAEVLGELLENTYKNCVLKTDETAGRLLDSFEQRALFDDTVVMVTGDHGEEFGENGFWGHTSNFSPQQVEVPFYLKGPGVEPGVETRPTSHLDVSNSLLELLGADPARRRDYSLGESLFAPLERRDRVVAGYAHLGIWTDSGIFGVPLRPGEPIEVFDDEWRLQPGTLERCRIEEPVLLRTAEECVRFLDR